jgi:hypothetical protein
VPSVSVWQRPLAVAAIVTQLVTQVDGCCHHPKTFKLRLEPGG